MPAPAKDKPTIVIKKIKKGGHGHHGGAWKIAYADFVTAMMAFFLLMWLLGSTTKGELQGIANYFQSPFKVAMAGGTGAGDSSSVIKGGGTDLTRQNGNVKRGERTPDVKSYNLQAAKAELARVERERLNIIKQKIEAMVAENPKLAEFKQNIRLDLTADGLRIQIVDDQNRPMFDLGGAQVKEYMRDILRAIGRTLNDVPNRVTLSGHTDASQYASGERGYSNWELSSDRANASRRELIAGGMDESKIFRVVGLAASVPLNADDAKDPANRRISVIVMNKAAEERMLKGGGGIEATDEKDVSEAIQSQSPNNAVAPSPREKVAFEQAMINLQAAAEAKATAQAAAQANVTQEGSWIASSGKRVSLN